MLEFFQPFLEDLTLLGLFFALLLAGLGVPIPEDFILISGGMLVHEGLTTLTWAVPVLYFGAVLGDVSIYLIGRRFGHSILRHPRVMRWVTQERQERLGQYFVCYGNRTVFLARYLACCRALTYLTAGAMKLPVMAFIFWDSLGALISVPLMIGLGYAFADHMKDLYLYMHRVEYVVGIAVIAGMTGYLFYHPLCENLRKVRSSATRRFFLTFRLFQP
jgi:membrane protein DedA with SNARE-associated domain